MPSRLNVEGSRGSTDEVWERGRGGGRNLNRIVETLGDEAVAPRLAKHIEQARSDTRAFEASSSHALATLRRRDEELLHAMLVELKRAQIRVIQSEESRTDSF